MENIPAQQHVGPLEEKTRIDKWLSMQYQELPRAYWCECLKQGLFRVNSVIAQPKTLLKEGDLVEWLHDEQGLPRIAGHSKEFTPEPGKLRYVKKTKHYAVIDKPAGLVVHPGAGVDSGTLAHFLAHDFKGNLELPNWGLVHRLDKDTSGLMVVALTPEGYHALNQQILEREMSRIYLAFVWGVMRYSQTVEVPIGRDPHNRLKKKALPHDERARFACTHVKVLERFASTTLVECELETGRTHQIRVHLEHIGFPLVGEQLYSCKRAAKELFARQALHAHKLSFYEPLTERPVSFESPLPDDLSELYSQLQASTKVP